MINEIHNFLLIVCYYSNVVLNMKFWSSQPKLQRGLFLGDLLEGAGILFSGSNFAKMELFARFMHIPFINEATYYRYQSNYLVPVVEKT